MSNSFSIAPTAPEAPSSEGRSSFQQNPRRRQQQPAPEAEAPAAHSSHRLVIEENAETGDLIYTVIDLATGDVVMKTSREEVARMSQRADYAAGTLIRTEA